MKLEERKREDGGREGIYFYAYSENGKKYSVVNIGKLMETDPSYSPEQWEKLWKGYWESVEVKQNGEIDVDTITWANSWEELEFILTQENI